MTQPVLIDAHVHIYPHYDVPEFLQAAWENLTALAKKAGHGDAVRVLLLTETAADDAFARLADGRLAPDGWQVTTYPDDNTALTLTKGEMALTLIAGRQIVTAERLEVHALATRKTFIDAEPTQAVLDRLKANNIPAVLPWGVGKWVGKRGKIMDALVRKAGTNPGFMLGDNGGRPIGWPRPKPFKTAANLSIPVLPGSDPLPIIGAEQDVGRFGALVDLDLDMTRPGASLRAALFALRGDVQVVGGRKGPLAVIRDQRQLRSNRQN